MVVEQVSEVGRGLVIESFMSEEKDFELNSLWHRETMKVLKDWSDVVAGESVGE